MNTIEQAQLAKDARKKLKGFQEFFRRFRRRPGKEVDEIFHATHDEVFAQTDCTQCANCCLLGTPIFSRKDIERLAAHFRMNPGDFQQQYLTQDKTGDIVLQKTPCPFLGKDLQCTVYESRPEDCRNFPHTRRKPMGPMINTVLVNTAVCPAAMEIVEKISAKAE